MHGCGTLHDPGIRVRAASPMCAAWCVPYQAKATRTSARTHGKKICNAMQCAQLILNKEFYSIVSKVFNLVIIES